MDTTENDTLQHAVYEQALALYQAGNYSEVVFGIERVVPEAVSVLLLSIAAYSASALGRDDEAEKYWRSAIAMNDGAIDAYNELGILLKNLKRFDESESVYAQAIKCAPKDAKLYNNLANLYRETGCFEKAVEEYKEAISHDPQYAEAYRNLGTMYKELHRYEEAETAYKAALQIAPDCVRTRANLGFLLLELGRYEEGWPLYETRYDPRVNPSFPAYEFSCDQWRGEPLIGKTILLVSEQGYGDDIQFIRFAALLKERGAEITLMCKQPLRRLFSELSAIDHILDVTETPPKHDFWSFLLSVPLYLGITLETIPDRLPYLKIRPEWVTENLILPEGGFKVGLVWKGSSEHGNDSNRSLHSFGVLEPLWSVPNVTFVSLQKEVLSDNQVKQPIIEREIEDFVDTSVLISQLDLVICVDTSVAHLCGALGKVCWVLLPFVGCDWRWLQDRDDSPWYPIVMRLFRQKTPSRWDDTVAKIVSALSDEVAKRLLK
ncbi:tetratricopeptide repeat-containing glycosyltransferase family protein [Sulfuricurvum sp.]|uniref:tetratricopeptide repeat-containing glycosyltransferase family protein n=1 Tax=Sulfuricurvum sp. TaxID=2025608 RepID=UPI002D28BEEC|nr:tetratricopeptide repeat-containing glycosyltransferase family protein [Sulfuricurvum sp.]HZF70785.1 tetratricopeptide repeat-containing glycosyltransferase family protein [Sulfuricurvum sp.]